jgi:translation elongation factor EF-G
MRKIIIITLFISILSTNSFSQSGQSYTVDKLFSTFAGEKNAVNVKIGKFAMSFANLLTGTKGVTGVEVKSFDECEKSIKERFNEAINNLKDDAYETLVQTRENGEITKILVKIEKEMIRELIVITGGKDVALIRITGKIKPKDIEHLINKNSKKG